MEACDLYVVVAQFRVVTYIAIVPSAIPVYYSISESFCASVLSNIEDFSFYSAFIVDCTFVFKWIYEAFDEWS